MIEFKLQNGDTITLDAGAKVEFQLVSSLQDADIPAAHSTSIQITDVNGNFRKLGFVNRLDILQRIIKHDDVQLIVNGRPEYIGQLYVRRKNKKGLSCFYVPNGFAADILDQYLQDVDYGNDVVLGSTTAAIVAAANAYVPQNYPDVNFNFPTMYAPKAYDIENAIAWRCEAEVPFYDYEESYAINDFVKFAVSGESNLFGVYRCIAAAAPGDFPFNSTYWVLEDGNCLVNNWDHGSSSFRSNDITGLETFNKHALSPQLFTKFILDRIAVTYGRQIVGDFIEDTATDQALTHNNVLLDRGERQFYVRAEQDGVYDVIHNPYAGSGIAVIAAAYNRLIFNDETTAPNEDADGVFDALGGNSQYTIQNAGRHTFSFYLDISANTNPGFTRLVLVLPYSGATPNIGDDFGVIPNGYTGVFEYTFTYDAVPADVGQYIQADIYYITGSNTITLNAGSYMVINNDAANNMNRYKGTVEQALHVPDVTVADYLVALKRRFNLNVIIDVRSKVIRLDYAQDILEQQPDDFTDILQDATYDFKEPQGVTVTETFNAGLDVNDGVGITIAQTFDMLADITAVQLAQLDIGDVVYVKSDNTLYSIQPRTTVWKQAVPIGNYYPELVYGKGKKMLDMIGQPANMHTIYHDIDAIVVPRFEFLFSSDLFGMGRNECPLIFSFWRGLKDMQGSAGKYPFASPHPYEPNGTAISNAVDLRFYEASESIWQQKHKEWVRKTDGGLEVFADADMNQKQIFEWTFTKPIHQRNNLLVRQKLIYQIDQDGNISAEVQAIKVIP